jgi:trigger factor
MSLIAEKKLENIENSAVKLTVTVSKDTAKEEYKKLLKDYSRKAHIKGFRKGKAPVSVLENKFGEAIKSESFMNLIEKSVSEALDTAEKKPLYYSQPTLLDEENLNFSFDEDFSYAVSYDIFPEFELGEYTGIEYDKPSVTIKASDIKAELEKIQQQNAMVIPKASGTVAKDDIVTVNFAELDENDNEIEGSKREDFTFTVGTGYNTYKIDEDILRWKKGTEKVIEKTFPEDFENPEMAGKSVKLKVAITEVKVNDLPAIDDELAQDVDDKFETLDDLKASIKERLTEQRDAKLREVALEQILNKVQESTTIEVPESMIKNELESNFSQVAQRFGISAEQYEEILQAQGKDKEAVFAEWKEDATKNLKNQLILGKIVEAEKIETSDEDFDAEIKKSAELYGKTEEEIKKMFEAQGMKDYLLDEIKTKKAVDLLIKKGKAVKGEKQDFVDLISNN